MLEALASHLDAIAALAPTWGFAAIFFFMAVESSFIPFPSEVVMIPAGFLAARGELIATTGAFGVQAAPVALSLAVLTGIAGSLAGAYLNYYLALKLGKPFLEKYGKWFFVKPEPLAKACEVFNKYGAATTFVCRLIPVIRQLISIPAGISRMPLGSFSAFTALGAGIWSAILAAAGYWLGKTSGSMTYLELVTKGKDMSAKALPYVIVAAFVLVGMHLLVAAKMGKKR